jgi:UDP-N-acetylmuramoylalanine--D-glutamate ligase
MMSDKPQRILILGLGRAGRSMARFLLSRGDDVLAYDDNPKAFEHDDVRQLSQDPSFRRLSQLAGVSVDFAIASPGIPEGSRPILALRRQQIRIIDEIEFGYEIVGKRIVAVTGTNGKSTVVTLIGEMLKADGRNSFYGGNLAPGLPFSSALLTAPKDWYVLEVSTFQLERCEQFAPKVALLLNIAEDHLNRHGSFERYQELKFSIFRNQTAEDFAIVNQDDKRVSAIRKSIRSRVMTFSLDDPKADAVLCSGQLELQGKPLVAVREMRLPGRHNIANALAAMLAAEVLNVKHESMIQVLTTFSGLEHRLEMVREIAGVRYVNNSMCTNPAAAVQSLLAFDAPVVLITGGREKDLPIDDYLATIKSRAKAAILVGENRVRLFDRLKGIGYGRMQVAETLVEAVQQARSEAEPGDIVLFSPGFASFDAYPDFQERGRAFKDVVAELDAESTSQSGCCAAGVAR